jgi:hypothetical protein
VCNSWGPLPPCLGIHDLKTTMKLACFPSESKAAGELKVRVHSQQVPDASSLGSHSQFYLKIKLILVQLFKRDLSTLS